MNSRQRFVLCVAMSVLVLGAGCRAPRSQTTAPATAGTGSNDTAHTTGSPVLGAISDRLVSLNKLFLDAYRERQVAVKKSTSPLIVANFSNLELYWNGVAETNRCIPEIYQALKVVAHVPFGLYLRVIGWANETNDQLPDSVVRALRVYRTQIAAASDGLAGAGFSETQLRRQKQILAASTEYVSSVITAGKASRPELLAFARNLGPLLLENANDAAAAELEMTHAAVMAWKNRMPADDWRRLVVVVRGPQMPRRMNILTQYFAKVLEEPPHGLGYPQESRRLIYAEFIPQGRDHLDLMATTFVDGDASEAFFGDRWRMSRDLLADGAEEVLRKLD